MSDYKTDYRGYDKIFVFGLLTAVSILADSLATGGNLASGLALVYTIFSATIAFSQMYKIKLRDEMKRNT